MTLRLGSFSKIGLELGIHHLWRLALSPSSDKDRDQSTVVSSKKYTSSYSFLLHDDRDECRHRNMGFSLYVINHFIEMTPKFNGKFCSKYKYITLCN